jgi:hypothetical protein
MGFSHCTFLLAKAFKVVFFIDAKKNRRLLSDGLSDITGFSNCTFCEEKI